MGAGPPRGLPRSPQRAGLDKDGRGEEATANGTAAQALESGLRRLAVGTDALRAAHFELFIHCFLDVVFVHVSRFPPTWLERCNLSLSLSLTQRLVLLCVDAYCFISSLLHLSLSLLSHLLGSARGCPGST